MFEADAIWLGCELRENSKKEKKKEKALIVISTFAYILGQTDVEPFAGSTSPPPLYLKLRKTVERKNILIYFDTRKFFWLLRGWK